MQKLHDKQNVGKVLLDPSMEPKEKVKLPICILPVIRNIFILSSVFKMLAWSVWNIKVLFAFTLHNIHLLFHDLGIDVISVFLPFLKVVLWLQTLSKLKFYYNYFRPEKRWVSIWWRVSYCCTVLIKKRMWYTCFHLYPPSILCL